MINKPITITFPEPNSSGFTNALGTKVYDANGTDITKGIRSITLTVGPRQPWQATIEMVPNFSGPLTAELAKLTTGPVLRIGKPDSLYDTAKYLWRRFLRFLGSK